MPAQGLRHSRKLTIIAKDPAVRVNGRILTTEIAIPMEDLEPGPNGCRVRVIDFDVSSDTLYRPFEMDNTRDQYKPSAGLPPAYYAHFDEKLLNEPEFHAQNVYAIVMRVLARFEFALGRRVRWSFGGHQIIVAPHAFSEANAFYSKEERALLFGYFPARANPAKSDQWPNIFTCLAHDVIAHETTHALLDGLRERYADPCSPEQAGFHEGFADIVALLSIFSLRDVVDAVFAAELNPTEKITVARLRSSAALFGLGKQLGDELSEIRGEPLRRSVELLPSSEYINDRKFEEPHRRGEILVAAVLNAFLEIWVNRIDDLPPASSGAYDWRRVVEEGANIADYLLTMCIRAIDYCPPTDVQFCDFLSAILTADMELHPDDSTYDFRSTLLSGFESYGIEPTSKADNGFWEPPNALLAYDHSHYEALQREPDEVFRFLWQNRNALGLHNESYTRVISVRSCQRVGPDGFVMRETVAEYVQTLELRAAELERFKIKKPDQMPAGQALKLYGGGTLIFDEFCRLKYHVRNKVTNVERQTQRLKYLWRFGFFKDDADSQRNFADMHRMRVVEALPWHSDK